jgi:hypothetical protein
MKRFYIGPHGLAIFGYLIVSSWTKADMFEYWPDSIKGIEGPWDRYIAVTGWQTTEWRVFGRVVWRSHKFVGRNGSEWSRPDRSNLDCLELG